MMKLTNDERRSLIWLSQQSEPVWGGHLERGEPIDGPRIDLRFSEWVRNRLVEEWPNHHKRGYRITEKGRVILKDTTHD